MFKHIVEKYKKEIENTFATLSKLAEPSFKEYKTTTFIVEQLKKHNVNDLTNLQTGCFGTLNYNSDKTLAIRADIDALPFNDEKTEYRHLCGHHFHTTALLETIKIIKNENLQPNYNLRFIFQPAEEIVQGAKFVIKHNVMKGVDEIYGLHVDPELQTGTIYAEPGPVMAGARHFNVVIRGKSTHAAYPHMGFDPIAAASNFIVTAQNVVARNIDPLKSAVLTFGAINGGTANNIIPEMVTILGTFRFLDSDVGSLIETKLKKLLESTDTFFQTTSKLNVDGGTIPVVNNSKLSEKIKLIFKDSDINFFREKHVSMGGEDFCFYHEFAPAIFIKFGVRENSTVIPIHNKDFTVSTRPLFEAINFWLTLLHF